MAQKIFESSDHDRSFASAMRARLARIDFHADKASYDSALIEFLKFVENTFEYRGGHPKVYLDFPNKNPTIGTGFNMGKPGSKREKEALEEWKRAFSGTGPNFYTVRNGTAQPLTQIQMDRLLQVSVDIRRNELFGKKGAYSDFYRDLSSNIILVIESTYFHGPKVSGGDTRFYKNIRSYAQTSERNNLEYAIWEILTRSNPERSKGIQRRREIEAIVLNSIDIDLLKLPVPLYADPFGFVNEVNRLRDTQARTFIDAVIARHRVGFMEQMRALGRPGPFATPDFDSLRTRFANDFERALSSLNDHLLNKIEKALQEAEQNGTTPQQIRNQLRSDLQQELFDKGAGLRTYFAQQLDMASQQAEGLESYVWRSMNDDKVRAAHAANDDHIFNWNDPPPTGHPGQEYGLNVRPASDRP